MDARQSSAPRDDDHEATTIAMESQHTIRLFGDYILTADQARAAIRTHAHADIIREWCTVPPASNPDATACYAGVRSERAEPPLTRIQPQSQPRLLVGHGPSPVAALEDLLWQVVGPHLLMTQP
jgi:hypothetical protein